MITKNKSTNSKWRNEQPKFISSRLSPHLKLTVLRLPPTAYQVDCRPHHGQEMTKNITSAKKL